MLPSIAITSAEFAARRARLREHLDAADLAGAVLFDNYYVLYYAGFAFIPRNGRSRSSCRPGGEPAMLLASPRSGARAAARPGSSGSRTTTSFRDPTRGGLLSPSCSPTWASWVASGADQDGYPWILGYRGPPSRSWRAPRSSASPCFRRGPDGGEVRGGDRPHPRERRSGGTSRTVSSSSTRGWPHGDGGDATRLGRGDDGDAPDAWAALPWPEPAHAGAHAGYRGQIGRGAAIPHALANNVVFQAGDVLVTGASAAMWGYLSELERTMVIGPSE